jgi:hypothetical protein
MAGHMQANYNEAMRALFRNTDITWTDDLFKEDGSITVKPLVNGDGSFTPPEWRGNTFTGSHTHFVTTGGATLDEADLVALADHLREHGYGVDPSVGGFGGQIVVWINNAQVSDVQGHTNFVAANDPIVVNINKIYAGGVNQDRYLGYNSAARVWLREVPYVPASYYIGMVTTETGDSPQNGFAPLRRRIPTTAALQGIRRFEGTDYPLQESWWQDFFGFGVYNRISAVVGKVTAGAYDIPTIG